MQIYVVISDNNDTIIGGNTQNELVNNVTSSLKNYQWQQYNSKNINTLSYQQIIDFAFNPQQDYHSPNTNYGLCAEEAAISMAHTELWQRVVDEGANALIFNEDIYLCSVTGRLDFDKYNNILNSYDILFLGCEEENIDKIRIIDSHLYQPVRPRHICAYALTPAGAKKLLAAPLCQFTITLDDYLTIMCNDNLELIANVSSINNCTHYFRDFPKLAAAALKNRVVIELFRVLKGIERKFSPALSFNQ